jgi:23S rRNA pseudouridine2604 synthase
MKLFPKPCLPVVDQHSESSGETIRLNKLMAHRGLCSRREADALIAAGRVRLNGELVSVGSKVDPNVEISIDGEGEAELENKWVIMLNKPRGYVSHLAQEDQRPASDLVTLQRMEGALHPLVERICREAPTAAVAGRLDRSSRGLLLMCTDGRVVSAVTRDGHFPKKYLVECTTDVSDAQIKALLEMRRLNTWKLRPMEVSRLGPRRLRFVLREGKKHQIREVCHAVDLDVRDLYRVSVGPLELGPLADGQWRMLNRDELSLLLEPIKRR